MTTDGECVARAGRPRNRLWSPSAWSTGIRRRIAPRFGAFLADREGLAVIEFAFILPILVVMWLGSVEFTQALSVNRKVGSMVASAGELVAQSRILTYSDVDHIFDIATAALSPFDPAGASIVLTAIDLDENGRATVAWSRGRGTARSYREGMAVNLTVNAASTERRRQVIMAEADYPYRPAIGYMLAGLLTLNERMFFTPPPGAAVRLCDNTLSECN